jgi:cation transport regulator ChaC
MFVDERVRARVHGYHRGLYLWSHEHRGTPEMPGLVFGLDRGGSCSGFAYRLPEEQLEASLYALWQREMPYPPIGRTGSAAVWKMAARCRLWVCPGAAPAQLCRQLAGHRA